MNRKLAQKELLIYFVTSSSNPRQMFTLLKTLWKYLTENY